MTSDDSTIEVDVLVAGSGIGGLSAALYAAKAGLGVLLCEKHFQLGGTTATSGGIAWIPCNPKAAAAGVGDSLEEARRYIYHEIGNAVGRDLIEAFLDSGGDALREIEADTQVVFDLINWPDYHPDSPGALKTGRSLLIRPYDARSLGRNFEMVRPPMKRLMVLGGLMLGSEEIASFLAPFASFRNFARVTRKLARYGQDRLRFRRGTEVAAGNALVCRMLASLLARNVPIWTSSPLIELQKDSSGRVVGAVVTKGGRAVQVKARCGVVLATGGFPRNEEMLREFGPDFPHSYSLGATGNTGDGIAVARSVGALVDTDLKSVALWSPGSILKKPDGSLEEIIYGYIDRGKPGVIAVDRNGRRFVNESNSYHDIVMSLFAAAGGKPPLAYFVCDRDFVRKYGLGIIRPEPFTRSLRPYISSGYIVLADSLEDLGARIGVDPRGLAETVAKHNEYARSGRDLEFGKGDNMYNRLLGDPRVKPNPNLAPIEKPPFVSLRIEPMSLGTTIGLKTDHNARVIGIDGNPVSGLYACGNDLASIMRGAYPGGGVTIGPALVFAYRAVQDLRQT